MAFRKGDPNANRDGRPKGAVSKVKRLTNDERLKLVKDGNLTPLIFLQSVVMDEGEETMNRVRAASEVAPYLFRKKPTAIEGGDRPLTILSADQLSKMGDDDVASLNAALIALGAGLSQNENKPED